MDKTDEYSFVLAPSEIAGVGVFATHNIKKGTALQLFLDEPRFIPYTDPILQSPLVKNFCIWYCVEEKDGYSCARDFRKMEIGWHLNHSKEPNAGHKEYEFFALKDIKKGEEIVIDYEDISESEQTLKPIAFDKFGEKE